MLKGFYLIPALSNDGGSIAGRNIVKNKIRDLGEVFIVTD
jgi:hypothetical protein